MNLKYFEFTYDKNDELFAETLAGKADKLYEDMLFRFHFENVLRGQKISVTICESVSGYLTETNKSKEEYQEWMVGNCDYQNRKITILSPRISTTHTAAELEKVFVHETIHLFFDIYVGIIDTPIWCAEGIAILFANQVELNYINENDCPRIENLLDEETFAENGGYEYSGAYVWFFIKRYGFHKFLELYRNKIDTSEYIYDGFEQEAIHNIIESNKNK